jgi:F420-dependent oxidoreductase-like protein
VSEGFHGVRFAKQLQRTREYVAVVRKALGREKIEFHGETLELPLPDGPGKALKLTIRPVQQRIPIFLAVLGPKNVALAGEIADGWLPVFFSPEHTKALRGPLEEGAARAGRSLDAFLVCPSVNVMIGDDVESARNAVRPVLALYVGGMGSREQNFYNRLVSNYGFEREAQQVQELYLEGRRTEAMFALPDELIDMVCLVGPRDRVRERLRAYRDAGVDTLIVWPVMPDQDERKKQLHILAELNRELA